MTKLLYIFDEYTTYSCKEPCKLNTRGYEKLAFFDKYFAYFENGIQDTAMVQWKTINCRQFCC